MVGLVGETLLCTDTIYRKKKPCLHRYSFLQAFALCWLKTIRRLSRVSYGHFHLFTIRSCQEPIPLSPSSSSSFNIPDDKALKVSSPAWPRLDAPRCHTNPLSTHTCWKVWQTWWNSSIRFVPIRAHPEDNSITMRLLIRSGLPKHRRGVLPQSRNLLLFVATSLVTTMVIWWRGD